MKLKKGSQVVKLLIELVRGNEISRLPALTKLKVQNFQARVSDIKSLRVGVGETSGLTVGHELKKITQTTKNGREYTSYRLDCSDCKRIIGKALNALKRQAPARRVA